MLKKILALLAMLYAAATFAAVDVNKATAAELDSVKGIGPAISSRIVDERKKGSFKDWQDFIDRVKGVGENNAAKFSSEGVTVNGQAFKGAAAAATTTAKDKKSAKSESRADSKAEAKAEAASQAKADKAETKAEKKAEKKAAKDEKKSADEKSTDSKKTSKTSAKESDKAEAAKTAASAKK